VDTADDFGVVDALEVDAGDAQVGVTKLTLDHIQRDALSSELDRVRVTQLMGRESAADAGLDGEAAQLGANGAGSPRPSLGGSVDDAEQPPDRERLTALDPGAQLVPAPVVHADLAALAALATADQNRAGALVEVGLAKLERLRDAQPGAPEHDDQAAQPVAVGARPGLAHHGDDLLDPRRVRRIVETFVSRRAAGVVAGQRCRRTTAPSDIQIRVRFHCSSDPSDDRSREVAALNRCGQPLQRNDEAALPVIAQGSNGR
jgi:hypothetical protein